VFVAGDSHAMAYIELLQRLALETGSEVSSMAAADARR
jgi:hypothetical protein